MADFNQELMGKHALLFIESDTVADEYAQSCLFAESLDHSSDVQYDEYETRDCANPDAPAIKRKSVKSITDSLTGTGHVKNDVEMKRMDDWHYAQTSKNIELRIHKPNADGTLGALFATYAGKAKMVIGSRSMSPSGPIVRNATITFDGALTRTYAGLS